MIKFNITKRRILIVFTGLFVLYFLMLLPVFFMYPRHRENIELTIEPEYFYQVSDTLKGDCFRQVRKFIKYCAFPTREVHLNSNHTIVEILINGKWVAFDPLYKTFFNFSDTRRLSFDVNRNYTPHSLIGYKYRKDFADFKFYHHWYFIILNYTHPYYDNVMRLYYTFLAS